MTEREQPSLERDQRLQFTLQPGQQLEIALGFDGEVTLYVRPADPSQARSEPEPTVADTETAAALASLPASPPEKQQRVTLTGIVGTPVGLHTNRRGELVGSFQLGIPVEGEAGKKIWRPMVAFGERAERLRDQVHRGDEVTVIGYPHPRTNARGRVIDEVYLTAVRRVKPNRTPQGKPTGSCT